MTLTTTMELTRGELSILATAVEREWRRTHQLQRTGELDGWYDAKAKEKVAVHFDEVGKLFQRLLTQAKEMDNGSAT
jgi:hypothetical protein